MSKPFKIIVIAVAALLALCLIGIGILVATFNPNDYKPLLIRLVQEKKQRTLIIPGEIKLTFFPRIGLDLGRVSLSERNSRTEFASIDSAKLALELLPLLKKTVVVDHVRIDGLQAHVTRFKDGSTNIGDFFSREESGGQIHFNIAGVDINNAHLTLDDRKEGRSIAVSRLDLDSGKIVDGVPSTLALSFHVKASKPVVDAQISFKSDFSAGHEGQAYAAKNMELEIKGKLLGAADALFKLAGNAELGKEGGKAQFTGKLDDSSFTAKLGMTASPAAYNFDIDIDRFNADRYLGQPGASAAKEEEKPIDLSVLQDVRANGSLRIGTLVFHHLQLSKLQAGVRVAGGKLECNPLSANLYGGSAAGAVSAWGGKAPHFAVRQTMNGIQVGPLLKDATGKDTVTGRGNVTLDVTTAGGTFAQMKKNLDGSAKLVLHDGAVRGVNIAQTIRNAKAKIGELRGNAPAQSGTGSAAEATDFSEMSGSFKIAGGVARNSDLDIKSPLLRIGGNGAIDLGRERLDYLMRATVVDTLQGQGGPELQALKGLTIPVRLSGPFDAIDWHIEFDSLVRNLAKQKLDEKKDELKAKAREKVQEQLKDQLKGLFGK